MTHQYLNRGITLMYTFPDGAISTRSMTMNYQIDSFNTCCFPRSSLRIGCNQMTMHFSFGWRRFLFSSLTRLWDRKQTEMQTPLILLFPLGPRSPKANACKASTHSSSCSQLPGRALFMRKTRKTKVLRRCRKIETAQVPNFGKSSKNQQNFHL